MLKYHYSNPRFDGLPWLIDRKGKKKKTTKKQRRRERRRERQKQNQERDVQIARCREYLMDFWPKFNIATVKERIELLRRAANPPWDRITAKARERLRAYFRRHYFRFLNVPIEVCISCESRRPDEKHHIIPLAFGGINEDINLLAICEGCHDEIHPWMRKGSGV